MDISIVVTTVSMMAVIIAFGILAGLKLQITYEAKRLLMAIIINIAVPAIILNGVLNTDITDELLLNMLIIFVISILVNLFAIGLSLLVAWLFGFRSAKARKLAILSGIGNSGFIGIPLCAQIFGPVGGLLAAVFDAGLDVVVFTLIIILLQKGQSDRQFSFRHLKPLVNMPFIAILTGITIAVTGIEPPQIANEMASMLSGLAAPLAMIYVGLLIPGFIQHKKKIQVKFVSIALVMKLLLLPVTAMFMIQFFPLALEIKQVVFIQVAMPTFMLAAVLFARYADDEDSAVMTIICSTLLFLLTIPLMAYIATLLL